MNKTKNERIEGEKKNRGSITEMWITSRDFVCCISDVVLPFIFLQVTTNDVFFLAHWRDVLFIIYCWLGHYQCLIIYVCFARKLTRLFARDIRHNFVKSRKKCIHMSADAFYYLPKFLSNKSLWIALSTFALSGHSYSYVHTYLSFFVWYWYTSLIFPIKRRFSGLSCALRSLHVIKLCNEVLRRFYVINNTSDSVYLASREVDRYIFD